MIIGIRSDKGNFFRRIERQNAVVFQQNEGFLCRFFRQCAVLRAEIVLFFFLCIRIFIRIFKQSQLVFQFQNAQAALVETGIKLYGGVSGDADAAMSATNEL